MAAYRARWKAEIEALIPAIGRLEAQIVILTAEFDAARDEIAKLKQELLFSKHTMEREPTNDEALGMAWWNHITEAERMSWMKNAGSAAPADAWAAFKAAQTQTNWKCGKVTGLVFKFKTDPQWQLNL